MTDHTMSRTSVQEHTPSKSIPLDLRSPGWLAKWPIIGAFMFIFGSLVFGGLAYNLYGQGPLLIVDRQLASTLPVLGSKSPIIVKYLMDAGFYLGKEVVTVLVIIHVVYFYVKKYWQEMAMMLTGVIGGTVIFWILSHIINRQRPLDQIWIIVRLPGFPSGHAVVTVTFFGLLAYLIVPKLQSVFWKAFTITVTVMIMIFIGFSRIFTGGHYLTDILAGYAVGLAWAGLAYTLIEIYFQKRRNRNVQKEEIESN
jgi:membrane-associated phospholipid phosphatase